jgi:hypothetical protein
VLKYKLHGDDSVVSLAKFMIQDNFKLTRAIGRLHPCIQHEAAQENLYPRESNERGRAVVDVVCEQKPYVGGVERQSDDTHCKRQRTRDFLELFEKSQFDQHDYHNDISDPKTSRGACCPASRHATPRPIWSKNRHLKLVKRGNHASACCGTVIE